MVFLSHLTVQGCIFCCGLRTDKLVVFRQPESPRNQRRVCNVHRRDGYAVHHPRVELQRCFWLKKGGECVAEKREEEEERRRGGEEKV